MRIFKGTVTKLESIKGRYDETVLATIMFDTAGDNALVDPRRSPLAEGVVLIVPCRHGFINIDDKVTVTVEVKCAS